ncbi:MAG: AAA family ATPase [Chloroflexi bacterium]|nr:AAA family ATPase [Chloroflexota bacterium]
MPKNPTYNLPKLNHSQIRKTQNDPVWFAKNILAANPWKKQREILNALTRHDFIAVRSCNGAGKSYAAAIATIWWLMAHQDAIVITTAPSERQVRQILWREIRSLYLRNFDTIQGKITQTRLDISPRRFAIGFTATSEVRFQGFHSPNLLAIVDEASGVKEEIYDAVLSCLTSSNSKLLLIGNPTNLAGTFYDAFHDKHDLWHQIHISAHETPAFQQNPTDHEFLANAAWHIRRPNIEEPNGIATPRWAEHIANHHGEKSNTYQVRVLGQFPQPTPTKRRKSSLPPPAGETSEACPVPRYGGQRGHEAPVHEENAQTSGFPPLAGEMSEGQRGPEPSEASPVATLTIAQRNRIRRSRVRSQIL